MALTPKEWNETMEYSNSMQLIRATVAAEARLYLATLADGIELSTEKLVDGLYPRAVAEKTLAGDSARSRIYKIIAKLAANGLEDCCKKGEPNPKKFMGKTTRPWLWFNPGTVPVCYACGQALPLHAHPPVAEEELEAETEGNTPPENWQDDVEAGEI